MTDENGVPWDQFINQDGTLLHRESRDCFDEKGRHMAHPMRAYSKVSPVAWYPRLKDIPKNS